MNSKKFTELTAHAGWSFDPTAERAQKMAIENESIPLVMFVFNDIHCFVSPTTDLKLLYRDYLSATALDKEEIGPDCVEVLSEKDQVTIAAYKAKIKQYWAEKDNERQERDDAMSAVAEPIIDANPFQSDNIAAWESEIGSPELDGYARGTIMFADKWARIMQHYREQGETIKDCMEKAERHLSYIGITGNMYGIAVAILKAHWKYGEELRLAHNAKYGHSGSGTVNPARMVMKA